jgi:hypothetical protein
VPAVSKVTLPLAGAGELFMMLWLVFKGAKAPLPEARIAKGFKEREVA